MCCLGSFACLPCAICYARGRVLDGDWSKYTCCQGYFDSWWKCCCWKDGCGEKNCPQFCNCLECFCCPGCAISGSRNYLMDAQGIRSDPCDRRLIRFNNCLQCLAFICTIASYIIPELRDLANLLRCISNLVFCSIAACMVAQIENEYKYMEKNGYKPPPNQSMA